jgi:predicted dehydrogenase
VSDKFTFSSHTELLQCSDTLVVDGKSRLAEGVLICVQDRMHAELTIEFAKRGFHILCEKPLGVDVEECVRVTEEVERADIVYALGHSTCRVSFCYHITYDSHSLPVMA